MSVIFGKFNFDERSLDNQDLHKMQARLNHWNADKAQLWVAAAGGLGHLMLYNTPQSFSEALPYHDSLSNLIITADVRLDNREELFKKLNIDISIPDSKSVPDSFLILKAYQKYGSNCVKHLLGDFAFVIYNSNEKQLFCGRDHLGVKPFFYYQDSNCFAFASEKKGILTLSGIDQSINKQFLFNHLVFLTEQAVDHTLYASVKRLKPAHFLLINLNKKSQKLERYWTPDVDTELKFANKNEYYEGFRHHFEQAVQCRTISNYKIGVELSGGMDSSAITGAAHTYLTQQNKTLVTLSNTLSEDVSDPEIKKLDERQYIDSVIEHFKIKDFKYITQPAFDNLLDEFDFGIEVNDGLERWNPLWQLPLKKVAKEQNIRTLLSGFPGDELVTYRGKFYFLDYRDKRQYLKYFLAKKKHRGFNKIEPFLPHGLKHTMSKIKHGLGFHDFRQAKSYRLYDIPSYYKKHLTDCIWLDPYYEEQFKSYRHSQRYRILQPQVTHRMESETRYGIYFRTEPRFPMADIRLIQYYLSMPNELKYEGDMARTAFRKAMGQYLSPMVLQRDSKYGSVAPFLGVYKRFNKEEINKLIEQLPNLSFLKKSEYLRTVNTKAPLRPSAELMLWLIQNKDNLEEFNLA